MDFKVIEQAGLSKQEFADLIGISRMALHKIMRNGNYQRIATALTMLGKLVETGKLPRGYRLDDHENRWRLVEKLREKLDELAP